MAAKPPRLANVNHAAGIFADMSVDGPAIGTLVAIVDRAKNLPNRKTMGKQNPYCAARLGKEAKKTDTDLRGGQTPKWDQELRFTVHESPDYFRLKLSVFNDDKRTDLIGETWIDLKDLVIPGGSQSDQWHILQFRGKYAGEIRLEMTYYDTRPEDEAVIERRTQGTTQPTNRISAKSSSSPVPVSSLSSSLSGPRQLKEVKRRPLPTDPTGSITPRPAPEKTHSAPAPLPVTSHSSRPNPYESIPTPPSSSGLEFGHHHPRHTAPPEPQYDAHHGLPSPAMRPARTYETPDDLQRDWNAPAAPPAYQVPPPGPPKRHPQGYPQEQHYPSHRDRAVESQDHYARPRSGYDNAPPADYRSMRQDLPAGRQDPYHREPADMHASVHHEPPRPNSNHHYNNPYPPKDQYAYGPEETQAPRYHPQASGSMSGRHRIDYPQEDLGEPDRHYRPHSNSLPMRGRSPGRQPVSREGYHAEYAAMQPRVEDEEEEGPPPPPPVHRSGLVQPSQQLVPSPTPSYKAYSPEYGQPLRTSQPQPSQLMLEEEEDRFHGLPLATEESAMPPSLVAGLDPVIAEAESDRIVEARRRSGIFEEDRPLRSSREPSPMLPPYPTEPPPVEDHRRSLVSRKSINEDNNHQQLVPRKSISPRPPPSRGREGSQIPFSPDSFDSFNPHAARAAVMRDAGPAYETPAEAMEAARRSEAAASRQPGPIIGDDGREIDPSDHLPTDTWAPEPDRKPRKPGVIVRFRNAPPRAVPRTGPPAPPTKEYPSTRPTSSYMSGTDALDRSPRGDYNRGRQGYGGSPGHGGSPAGHGRTYSTPSPQPRRHSVSPSPSPMYAPANIGPPIPAKVPIGAPTGHGQDALSRELNSIDIGSVGFSSGRAMRKYVPKTVTGYAM